ncbi:chalcone-flavanone isomerase-domain-containing protein [Triangularia verruculosa]|uniref:Chalcone-flavanone isomerase-domain-containing protein n=1 Tax=Triangularia verruculosa TaxID=2587418 RepID=A0AAN6XE34_9PEZI|nr:chalcone-flavanone isomerase-domain-containing protein [Triangularia verruculosa]
MLRQPLLRQAARAARPAPSVASSLRPHIQRRTLLSKRSFRETGTRAVENLNLRNIAQSSADYHRNKRIFLSCGIVAGIVSFVYVSYRIVLELKKNPVKADADPSNPLSGPNSVHRKVVIQDEKGREIVPTGHSVVPSFPRTISLPAFTGPLEATEPSTPEKITTTTTPETEYTLVGLGTRTVTFIGISVYVVGFYIATADIAALQSALVKKVNPIATTLVPGERDNLRSELLDPTEGAKLWDELLSNGIPARTAFRVIPVRDTDFHHLRDGFVNAIKARGPELSGKGVDDEEFGEAMRQFRAVFNRGKVPKAQELILTRDDRGHLSIAFDAGKKSGGRQLIGVVPDERVSRALWLNYLGGKQVASEPARKSIVEGIMEFVERPVGTVASMVVPVTK